MSMMTVLRRSPVIPAIRREADLSAATKSRWPAIFLLYGDINSVADTVAKLRAAGKDVYVHVDLVQGLGADRAALRFLQQQVKPTGIVSTRSHLIRHAVEAGITAIQRLFILDSQALETGIGVVRGTKADAVEIMPGVLPPWVLQRLRRDIPVPIITGGLVRTVADAQAALSAGAHAVSVGAQDVWDAPELQALAVAR